MPGYVVIEPPFLLGSLVDFDSRWIRFNIELGEIVARHTRVDILDSHRAPGHGQVLLADPGHPTALLVFQDLPGDGQLAPVMRTRQLRFFNLPQWFTIAAVGAAVTAMVTFSYLRSLGAGLDVEHARAMALVVLTVASAGITANLSRLRTRAAWIMVGGTVALSWLFVQTPLLAGFLHLRPLHSDDWLFAIAGGLIASLLSAITSVRVRSTSKPAR